MGSEDGLAGPQRDLAQQLLDQSRGWDAEKRAALERFMRRPRAAPQPPGGQQPSEFSRHIHDLQREPLAPLSAGPLSSFYRILKDAPTAALQLPAPPGVTPGGAQQQRQADAGGGGGGGAARRGGGGAGGAGSARYDPYARPSPLLAARPPSRSGLLPPVPPSPLAR